MDVSLHSWIECLWVYWYFSYNHIYCNISLYISRTQPLTAFSNLGLHSLRLNVVQAIPFHFVLSRHRGHSLWPSPTHLILPLATGRRFLISQARTVPIVSHKSLLGYGLLARSCSLFMFYVILSSPPRWFVVCRSSGVRVDTAYNSSG
jgi:hypothetical protein